MAINTNITLRRLIAEIKEWADAHSMVEGFGYGEFSTLHTESEKNYPYLMLNTSNAGSDKWYLKFSLEFGLMGWVYDDKDNFNFKRVQSDTIEIIRDFQNTVEESPRWQSFSKINGDVSFRKFVDGGTDKVTGWGANINLWIKKRSGICDLSAIMPEYDFELQQTITPDCENVIIENSDQTFGHIAESGETYVLPDTTYTVFRDGVEQSSITVPSLTNLTINIKAE